MSSTVVYSAGPPVVRPSGEACHRDMRPDDDPDTYRPMPMPEVRKPRACEPWREVHRERGKRHRVTVTWDADVALARALDDLSALDLGGLS
jgi:hypothetical protein